MTARTMAPAESVNMNSFEPVLLRLKRAWQVGLLACAVMRTLGYAAVTLATLAALDFMFAFDPGFLLAVDIVAVLFFGVFLGVCAVRVARLGADDAAIRADRLLDDRRCAVRSALEFGRAMGRANEGAPGLRSWLMEQSIARAVKELGGLGVWRFFPFPEAGRRLRTCVLQLCAVCCVALVNLEASSVLLSRIVFPLRDTPPWSTYSFNITPATPKIIYGGNAEISVEIDGPHVKSQVWFLTRHRGTVHKVACFHESGRKYAQKLERVVNPVEFCFATGRARSRWHSVDLLLQPEISRVDVTIIPPAYTGLPRKQFQAGRAPIAGHKRSNVELTVRSNRPLTDGLLRLLPRNGLESERTVAGLRAGADTVVFNWMLQEDAEVNVEIRDVRGTRNRDPLKIEQKMVADLPPHVSIHDPAGFSMATPSSVIPLAGSAEDDLGLNKIELARTIIGYRDRIVGIGPVASETRFDFVRKLDLKELGVGVGQVMEFYAEARDSNPDLTGVSASDVVRVQVISEEEYAVMLRAKTTIEDFVGRYGAAREALVKFSKALEELKRAADAPKNATETGRKLAAAREAAGQATALFEKMAMDFVLFDCERKLADKARAIAERTQGQKVALDAANPPYDGLGEDVQKMLDELGVEIKGIGDEERMADEIARIARVMEQSAVFRELLRRQGDLVRRLERYAVESQASKDTRLLVSAGARQEEIRKNLLAFVAELQKCAGALPEAYADLKNSAIEFANEIGAREIPPTMGKAVGAAGNQDGRQTLHFAKLALERMKELKEEKKKTPFGSLLDDKIGFGAGEGLKETLEQMLAAIGMGMGRGIGRGMGTGRGDGIGIGSGGMGGGDSGSPDDGYSMGGMSPLNVPVFGPARMSFESRSGVSGSGRGGLGGTGRIGSHASEVLGARGADSVKSQSVPVETVPEKYRQALKKYFSAMEDKHE